MFPYVTFSILSCVCVITAQDPTLRRCQPVPMSDTAGMLSISMGGSGMCENLEDIQGFNECRGYCGSADNYNKWTREYEATCQCCRVESFKRISVSLNCEDGSIQPYNATTVDRCSCRSCGDSSYPIKPSNEPQLQYINY